MNSRWLRAIIDIDQDRHPRPLIEPRTLSTRVAGCCRDHCLFVVGALRERGVAARNRVGFASYLLPGLHLDHVVVEYWNGTRWVRTDPERPHGSADVDSTDMPRGPSAPFQTAAEVWQRYRCGDLDASRYCIHPGSWPSGVALIGTHVIFKTAHRYTERPDDDLVDAMSRRTGKADPAQRARQRARGRLARGKSKFPQVRRCPMA